jgi:YebC/PmpR family DNA-binding regulatory protein
VSGHNRWTKIKHKKAAQGAAKGSLFTKLIREITVAARAGGGDPAGNARLRTAIEAARDANMPSENVTRAVKKGTGELEGVHYEEATYEGYGPGGVALIVECLTDNRNRTAGDVRTSFEKGGGNLATPGSVAWSLERLGVVEVKPGPTEDQVTEAAIEAGAEDVVALGADGFEVRAHPNDLHAVRDALRKVLPVGAGRITLVPKETIHVGDVERARAILRLVDLLEELDDVQRVHGNFELDEAVLRELGS